MSTAQEWDQKHRQMYLEAPDPLAAVPARYLSAQGFAERILREIATEQKRRPPEDILEMIRIRCELLVWEGDE